MNKMKINVPHRILVIKNGHWYELLRFNILQNIWSFLLSAWYLVPQKLPQIYTEIAYICIGKAA